MNCWHCQTELIWGGDHDTEDNDDFERTNEKKGIGNGLKNITNLSHDRMLNKHHYTKQNLLFTCSGWNLARRDFSLKDMSLLMREDYFKNYIRILLERFPDQKYKINELKNGAKPS